MIEQSLYDKILESIPIVCVDVAIQHNEHILLIKRLQEPAKGEWWLPGGRLYKGEDLEACAYRKAIEETGLECAVIDKLLIRPTIFDTVHSINLVYLLKTSEISNLKSDGSWDKHRWVNRNGDYHPYIKDVLDICF